MRTTEAGAETGRLMGTRSSLCVRRSDAPTDDKGSIGSRAEWRILRIGDFCATSNGKRTLWSKGTLIRPSAWKRSSWRRTRLPEKHETRITASMASRSSRAKAPRARRGAG